MNTTLYTYQLEMSTIMCGVAIEMLLHLLHFWQYPMVSLVIIIFAVKLIGFSLA